MRWVVPLAALALALAAACGDDNGGTPTDTPGGLTPAGTKEQTPSPTSSGVAGPPEPADPTLDEQLTEIDAGSFEETIAAGGTWSVDTLALAEERTGGAPSCTNFAFDFTWQVQEPHPPDGVDLVWQFTREAGTVEVAGGPAGDQSVGCGLLEAVNRGPGPVTVAIRYRTGAI